jgi:glutaredoxin 3
MAITVSYYALTTCPYCTKLKAYLVAKGVPFKDMYVDGWSAERIARLKATNAHSTFPMVLVDGHRTMGCDDFTAWHQNLLKSVLHR